MSEKLARVFWQMGQPLLPEHFLVQEEAFLTDTELRFRLNGLPHYGIAEMEWRPSLLNDGVLSLSKLSLITPSGLFLAVPGNAKIVSPLNLGSLGGTKVQIYCHITKAVEEGNDMEGDLESDESDVVSRSIYELHISSDPGMQGALESMKLAEFTKDLEESWRLSEEFLPPLLLIGSSPFLKRSLDLLSMQLEVFHENLANEIAASYLSAESLYSAKACLEQVFIMQRLLLNLEGQISIHPYELYEKLLCFYGTICTYHNNNPEIVANLLYRHDALEASFRILDQIFSELKSTRSKVPYLPFNFENGRYSLVLPRDVREASAVYLLIQKKHVQTQINLSQLKLASPSRIPAVHKLALPGVPFRRIDRPPFQHSFGSEVDFYELTPGEEWDYALRELSVAFYRPGEEDEMTPYLYWRTN